MKALRAMLLASVCALTVGPTSAPLLDVERTETNVVIVETPAIRAMSVTDTSTTTTTTTPTTTTTTTTTPTTTTTTTPTTTTPTTTTTPAEVIEMATSTDVAPGGAEDLPVVVQPDAVPSP